MNFEVQIKRRKTKTCEEKVRKRRGREKDGRKVQRCQLGRSRNAKTIVSRCAECRKRVTAWQKAAAQTCDGSDSGRAAGGWRISCHSRSRRHLSVGAAVLWALCSLHLDTLIECRAVLLVCVWLFFIATFKINFTNSKTFVDVATDRAARCLSLARM